MTTKNFVKSFLKESEEICKKINYRDVEKIIEVLFEAWKNKKKVFTMANGGSIPEATHFAGDLAKYPTVDGKPRFRALCLNDNAPTISALTNDKGFSSIFKEQLIPWLEEGDVIVCFSVHGGVGHGEAGPWSQNLGEAVKLAKKRKAKIIGFSGDTGGLLREEADACIVVPTIKKEHITPHVEGWHTILSHLVVHRLLEMVENAK